VRHKLRFLQLSDAMMDKFIEKYPYYGKTTLKQVYQGMTGPMETLSIMNFMITNKDLPDDFIYNTVKVVWDNVDEIRAAHRVFETLADYAKNVPIPFHPGAVRYYEEKGIQLPKPASGP
jgi:TRAP transporter TAXI family solute receptor